MEYSTQKQSQELATKLWSIANELRGSMDASKFKNYILGVIFYRYLSEKTERYMNDLLKNDNITYLDAMNNEDYSPIVRGWSIEHLGYIIEPDYLWKSLITKINEKTFTIESFERAINSLLSSTVNQESAPTFEKLFDDMNLNDKDLGKEVSDRTMLISKVMQKINDISFNIENAEIDILGTAYMILISLFASDAGKKGGEFFTPTCVSKLLAKLVTLGIDNIKNVADSCAGSGSLLLEIQNMLSPEKISHFYATEKNGSNYNLLRMNLLMHNIPYRKFSCYNSDSIKTDNYYENGKPILFDIQVENPPYSSKYNNNPKLLEDPRFSSCGVLAPQGRADLMFVESMIYHMSENGRIACLLPSGVLFRGKQGTKKKSDKEYLLRKYLIENLNIIDAIIKLPPKMFHGTNITIVILILKKKREENSQNIFFIDASNYFKYEKKINIIIDEDINRIIEAYKKRKNILHFSYVAPLEEIRENDYNCNISLYVDTFPTEENININSQIESIQKYSEKFQSIELQFKDFLKEISINNYQFKDGIFLYPKWKQYSIGELFEERKEKDFIKGDLLSVTKEKGIIKNKAFSEVTPNFKNKYKIV